jgi:predicted aminopeptidase
MSLPPSVDGIPPFALLRFDRTSCKVAHVSASIPTQGVQTKSAAAGGSVPYALPVTATAAKCTTRSSSASLRLTDGSHDRVFHGLLQPHPLNVLAKDQLSMTVETLCFFWIILTYT